MGKTGDALLRHAEDIALGCGTLAVSAGVLIVLGIGPALIAFGLISIAYGVWITERRP
jgi:hypothetical protein